MADPPGLLGDAQQPAPEDQSWLSKIGGLLGIGSYDPAAAYSGDLSDPATKAAMRSRALGSMAQAFGQGAMPVPYKGGIPIGATLGNVAAAADAGPDQLIKARMEAAQTQQFMENAALLHQRTQMGKQIGSARKDPNDIENRTPGGDAPARGSPQDLQQGGGQQGPGAGTAITNPNATFAPLDPNLPKNSVAWDPQNQSGSEYLNTLAQAAAPYALPKGFSVEQTAHGGARPGATVEGTGGKSSHADALASDFLITGADGKPIDNSAGAEDSTGMYGRLALTMRMLATPDLTPWISWGGNYKSPYGRDIMHVDLQGDHGQNGTMAAHEVTYNNRNAPPGGPQAANAPPAPPSDQPTTTPPPDAGGGLLTLPKVGGAGQLMAAPITTAPRPGADAGPLPGGGVSVAGLGGANPPQQVASLLAQPPGIKGGVGPASGVNAAAGAGDMGPPMINPAAMGAGAPPMPPSLLAGRPPPGAQVAGPGGAGGNMATGLPPIQPPPAAPLSAPMPPPAAPAPATQAAAPTAPTVPTQPPAGVTPPGPASTTNPLAARPTPPPGATAPGPVSAVPVPKGVTAPPTAPTPPAPGTPALPPGVARQPTAQDISDANRRIQQYRFMGVEPPANLVAISKFGTDLATSGAQTQQKAAIDAGYARDLARYQAQLNVWEATNKPELLRQGTLRQMQDGSVQMNPDQYKVTRPDGTVDQYWHTIDRYGVHHYDYGGVLEESPYAKGIQTGQAATDIAAGKTLDDAALAANNRIGDLSAMRAYGQQAYMGPGAQLAQGVNSVLAKFGTSPELANTVATFEDLQHRMQDIASSKLGGEAGLSTIGSSIANAQISKDGFDRVVGQLQGKDDFILAKQQAREAWGAPDGPGQGTPKGFDAWWNGRISPYAFEYERMTPPQQQQLLQQLYATKGGTAEAAKLGGQVNLIRNNQLMNFPGK